MTRQADSSKSAASRYEQVRKQLFRLDAEHAHGLAATAARFGQRLAPGLIRDTFGFEDRRLEEWLWNAWYRNPIGLAAGFDKNARLVRFCDQLGFGFVEIGSVSARSSSGNPRPRLFRLPDDEAIINRMGLNNDGARRVAARIRRARDSVRMPIGINIAKTHDPSIEGEAAVADFVETFGRMASLADYVTLNVSCPNTAEGKTFEEPEAFDALLGAIMTARTEMNSPVPVLVKLSPPATPRVVFDNVIEDMISIGMAHGVHGFVAANTASDREGLVTPSETLARIGRGGLSGRPIEERATRLVAYLYARTGGQVPIIGVGGVHDGASAYRKIRAGASLVQIYTSFVYNGPGVVRQIKEELLELLDQDGFESVREAIGVDTDEIADSFGRQNPVLTDR
jgi:dihydroorotate dehydrogenase